MLKQLVREKHPLKGEVENSKILDEIMSDRVSLESFYWCRIIERMYDDNDVLLLE